MKRIKSYTGIWGVEKVIYAINDWTLPRPITFTQICWGTAFFILSLVMAGFPPFIFKDSMIMNNVAIPAFMAWFVSKKTFDGKKPYFFLLSIVRYFIRGKNSTRNKTVKLRTQKDGESHITVARRIEK